MRMLLVVVVMVVHLVRPCSGALWPSQQHRGHDHREPREARDTDDRPPAGGAVVAVPAGSAPSAGGVGGPEGTATRVVVNEDEYIFIAFEGPTLVEYEVKVLRGPNVDVFLMDEDNFRKYAADWWASASAWRVVDEGSKQGTRRAGVRLRVGAGLWFLVVDNRADDYVVHHYHHSDDYDSLATGPAVLLLAFNASAATIQVPARGVVDLQGTTPDGDRKTIVPSVFHHSASLRSAPVLRWSLLLFFAALPGWPLWRHYSIMVEYAGGNALPSGLLAWVPFASCAVAAAALPIAALEHSLHALLQGSFLSQWPPLFSLCDAFISVALPEEAVKWTIALLTLPVISTCSSGAHLLHGATVAIAFALVENVYYGVGFDMVSAVSPFDALFIRGLTSIPSHVVGGVIMGGLLYRSKTWWGFMTALFVPILLHAVYDYPIMLAHQGLFDTDILYIYLLLLLYLEDSIAHYLVLDYAARSRG